VENDVVTFLGRILQIPEKNMHDLANASRDMSLKLQFNLKSKHVTTQKELFKLFTDNYQPRLGRQDLGMSVTGLDHLFDRTGSFVYLDQ
jgi:hypothetical protein